MKIVSYSSRSLLQDSLFCCDNAVEAQDLPLNMMSQNKAVFRGVNVDSLTSARISGSDCCFDNSSKIELTDNGRITTQAQFTKKAVFENQTGANGVQDTS